MAGSEDGKKPRVTGVVLAAGLSSRSRGDVPKQLRKIQGETLVCRTARAALASKLDQVLVVAGHRASAVGAAVAGLAVEVVVNPDYAAGQSTSVKAGLSRLDAEADAVLFIPCDLPYLDPETLDRLLEVYAATGGPIVVPTFEDRRRAPVLLDRALFPEIAAITGDQGARQLFAAHPNDLVEVPFPSDRPFQDLDRG